MDTLIHWQWVTRLRLCASVPAPTSKELVCRSRGPTRSLRITWRCSSNARNDLFQQVSLISESSVVTLVNVIESLSHRNVLSEDKIGNQCRCHVRARWRRGRAIVCDLMSKCATGYHRWWCITARVDVHQWHTGYLLII